MSIRCHGCVREERDISKTAHSGVLKKCQSFVCVAKLQTACTRIIAHEIFVAVRLSYC